MPHNIPKSLVIPPLTKQEVIYILKRYREGGIGIERLAKEFSVPKKVIIDLVSDKKWQL